MKTFIQYLDTQLINELKLPKPKHRAKMKEYVRGLRNKPMANDPLVGQEMSDSGGYVRGKFQPQNPETGVRPSPPASQDTSTTPKYQKGMSPRLDGQNAPYVAGRLTKPERTNLDAHTRGLAAAEMIATKTDPKKIRRLKRRGDYSIHGGIQNTVLNRPANRIIQ